MASGNNSGNGSFVFGLIVGAIGGAAAALFMTPKRGEEMRKDLESRISEAAGPVRQRAEPVVSQGKERASAVMDRAADRAQELSGKIAAMELPFDDDERTDHEPGAAGSSGTDR